ncbi:alpha-L-fucosidase C-terminal domain-containing protein [Labilibaculum antarcticum]|uniref:Alpha-L-fucosidase C-terminal domain-containing protein n=1 Tax=Labilibaculum antarcticum TaxID=1717717 RepID=A0A1Y1CL70_9BACT|nr:hypothetical protein ALGA_2829 [Labilibaculum antarcticum]
MTATNAIVRLGNFPDRNNRSKNVILIGSDEKIEWEQTGGELTVTFPKEKPCDFAYCLKIKRKKILKIK